MDGRTLTIPMSPRDFIGKDNNWYRINSYTGLISYVWDNMTYGAGDDPYTGFDLSYVADYHIDLLINPLQES